MDKRNLLYPIAKHSRRKFISACGAECVGEDGKAYLDFDEMSVVLGQGNANFISKMEKALRGYTGNKEGSNPYEEKLTGYLLEGTNGDFKGVHYTASGSEAAEWAVKLAKRITGRTEVLSFWDSIHGRTQLSASMSGLPARKKGYGPIEPGLVFGIYPHCARCPFGKQCGNGNFYCLDFLDTKVQMESAQDLAAVIVEPYLGSKLAAPPKGYLKALYQWARDRGALFILDEVQSGMGRTGELFAYQKLGFVPDMLLLGKALGNGFHVSALLTGQLPDREMLPALAGGTGSDVLAMAAACAVWEELTGNGLLKHIVSVSRILEQGLLQLQKSYPDQICEICQQGLAAAVYFADEDLAAKVYEDLTEEGILPGRRGELIHMKPPFSITAEQCKRMLAAMGEAVGRHCSESHGKTCHIPGFRL